MTTRLAVRAEEAADLLSVSVDFFNDHIRPELDMIPVGRLVLFPVESLVSWIRARKIGGDL